MTYRTIETNTSNSSTIANIAALRQDTTQIAATAIHNTIYGHGYTQHTFFFFVLLALQKDIHIYNIHV